MPRPRDDPNHTSDLSFYLLEGILLPGDDLTALLPVWRGNRAAEGSLFSPYDDQALLGTTFYNLAFDRSRQQLRLYELDVPEIPGLIEAPVRVSLSEDMPEYPDTVTFREGGFSVTLLWDGALELGQKYVIGNLMTPYMPMYQFYASELRRDRGLRTYTFESLIGRLNRFRPKADFVDNTGPFTVSQALERIFQRWQDEFEWFGYAPIPPLYLRVGGQLREPTIPVIILINEKDQPKKTMREWLDLFLAPFAGYSLRANAQNKLEIIPPPWVFNPPPIILTDEVVGNEYAVTETTQSIVNAATVRSQGYQFVEGQEVLERSAWRMKPLAFDPSDNRRVLGYPAPPRTWGPVPADIPSGYKDLGQSLVVYPELGGEVTFKVQKDPAASIATDTPMTLTLTLYRWGFQHSNLGPIFLGSVNHTANLALDGSEQLLWDAAGSGWAPGPPIPSPTYVDLRIYGRFVNDGIEIRLASKNLHEKRISFSTGVWDLGFLITVAGTAKKWQRSEKVEVGKWGYNEQTSPGLETSQERFGVRELEVNTSLYQLDADTCAAMAQSIVEERLNPGEYVDFNLVDPRALQPDDVGAVVRHPSGKQGILTRYEYEENHSSDTQRVRVRARIRVTKSVLSADLGLSYFDEATYDFGRYE